MCVYIYVYICSKNLKCHGSKFYHAGMLSLSILCTFDCFDYPLLKCTCSFYNKEFKRGIFP